MKRHSRSAWMMAAAGLACALALAPSAARAQVGPVADEVVLPFLDSRVIDNGWPTPQAVDAVALYKASAAWAARAKEIEALRRTVPGLAVEDSAVYGTPLYVRSPFALLTPPSKDAPRDIVRGFVADHPGLFGDIAILDAARVSRDFATGGGLMHHFTFQQQIGGEDVYGCVLFASVTGRGELINIGSTLIPEPAEVKTRVIDALGALRLGARAAGLDAADPTPAVLHEAGRRTWAPAAGWGNAIEIESQPMWFAVTRDDVRPVWRVIVPTPGVGHSYEMILDGVTGEVLYRQDLLLNDTTEPATYRVYPTDSPGPWTPGPSASTNAQAPILDRSLLTVTPDSIRPFSPDGWIPDGQNTTQGNNCAAYNDAANDNAGAGPDFATGASRVFDPAINLANAPATYRDASIVNLFYHANRSHDRMWALGFDEAASNFQNNNFGRGGSQNDRINCESQDGSGTNNANFVGTGADGSTARIQMYIFTTASDPDRDGSLDSDVVYHELGHGTSIRLHAGLSGAQPQSMGEGWSDFWGTTMNAEPTDDFDGVYTTGGYITYHFLSASFEQNYYFGIRRWPYSTDVNKNPTTYADIDPAQYNITLPGSSVITPGSGSAGEVHNAGEVWCNALLEARASMGIDQGFAANQIIQQLVTDGMKLAPHTSGGQNFVNERDAIIQADLVRYGGAHSYRLWQAFAKRGLGEGAASPGGASNTGVVESFTLPQRVDFTFPDGLPEQFSPSAVTTFRVDGTPFNTTLTPNSGVLFYALDNGAFQQIPMVEGALGHYTATIPATPCFSTVKFYFSVGTSVGNLTGPRNAPAAYYSGLTYTGTTVFGASDMEAANGWTVGPSTATAGLWGRMDPEPTVNAGQPFQPGDDHTPDPGVACWVTDGRAGTSVGQFDVDSGYTYLNTPVYDLSAAPVVVVEYWRWFQSFAAGVSGTDEPFTVEASNDGGSTWTVVDLLPRGSTSLPEWTRSQFIMSPATVPTSAQVKFRFKAEDDSLGYTEAAVDDFRMFRYDCNAGPSCDPDYNQDGNVDQDDIRYLVGVIAGSPNPTGMDPDFNGDGNVDQDDYVALVNVIAGAPCP